MAHYWPKEFLVLHCTVFSFGQMAQLIMITLSLTTCLTLLIGSRCLSSGAYTIPFLSQKTGLVTHTIHRVTDNQTTATFYPHVVRVKYLLTLTCIGGAEGYCNCFVCLSVCLFVCLSAKFQWTYEHWHFENTTNRFQIIIKSNNRLSLKPFCI